MVRFSRVWRAVLRMGHPQVRWSVLLMTQNGGMPVQLQGDGEGVEALPLNWMECGRFSSHVQPQGCPTSLRGAGVVQPLGVNSGHLPERCRTYATGCACGEGRRCVRVAGPPWDAQCTANSCATRCPI